MYIAHFDALKIDLNATLFLENSVTFINEECLCLLLLFEEETFHLFQSVEI